MVNLDNTPAVRNRELKGNSRGLLIVTCAVVRQDRQDTGPTWIARGDFVQDVRAFDSQDAMLDSHSGRHKEDYPTELAET